MNLSQQALQHSEVQNILEYLITERRPEVFEFDWEEAQSAGGAIWLPVTANIDGVIMDGTLVLDEGEINCGDWHESNMFRR